MVAAPLLSVLPLAAAPGAAEAQGSVRLIPQVGLYVPMSDLGRVQTGSTAVDIAKMESTLGLGLSLELGARDPWSFRLNGVYGTASDVPIARVGCADCAARSTVAVVTGSVVVRPLPNLIIVRPYLQGGLGLKRYDFDEDDLRAEQLDAFVSDQNKLTGQLGVGAELNLGLRLLFEVSDFINRFEPGDDQDGDGKTQHDFFITLGFALGG